MIVREWWAEAVAGEVGHGDGCFGAVVAVGAAGEQAQVGVGGLGAGVWPGQSAGHQLFAGVAAGGEGFALLLSIFIADDIAQKYFAEQ